MNRGCIAGVLLLLLVPPTTAQTTADLIWEQGELGEIVRYRVVEQNIEDTSLSHEVQGNWLDFTPYEKAIPQSIMFVEIHATYTMQLASDGVWNVTVETSNGHLLDNCYYHVTTVAPGGFLEGDLVAYATYTVKCATIGTATDDAPFTLWVNRTILTGTPDTPLDSHITVVVDRGDFIVTSQKTDFELLTNLTAFEFAFIFALLLFGLWLWGREDFGVRFFGATLVVLDFSLTLSFFVASRGAAWPLFSVLLLTMFALAFWMYYGWFKDYALRRRGTL